MIVRIVKLTLSEEYLDTFIGHFEMVRESIKASQGCLYLELIRETNLSGVLFTLSHWESEASLRNYLESELFISIWKQVKPMFVAKAEAWSLNHAG